jgi:hypothetical protein
VHVRAIDNLDRPPTARLDEDGRLLAEMHGTLREVRASDPASGLIHAARQAGACQFVIGTLVVGVHHRGPRFLRH